MRLLRPIAAAIGAALIVPGPLLGQCSQLLVDGVLRTLELNAGPHARGAWHQAWCGGTLGHSADGRAAYLAAGGSRERIAIGLPFTTAEGFQHTYREHFCGGADAPTGELADNAAVQAVAPPALLEAYGQCRAVERRGLEARFDHDERADAFVVSLRHRPDAAEHGRPALTGISFVPALPDDACTGPLAEALRAGTALSPDWTSMACRRERGQSLVALVATDAGSFHTTIEAHLGAPTSTDLVLAALPAGIILPWFAAERFPAGFVLCDGTGGLPDLVDRFPLGTADARDVGSETGGATHEHRLTHLTTGRARSGEGGASDGWSATGMDRVGRPQTTGLDHAHGIQGGKAMEASSLPPSTRVMFICKS